MRYFRSEATTLIVTARITVTNTNDSGLGSLARAAYHRGRGARSSDLRRGDAPALARELRILAGCGWHTVRRACPQGVVMGAHAAGRVMETLRPR